MILSLCIYTGKLLIWGIPGQNDKKSEMNTLISKKNMKLCLWCSLIKLNLNITLKSQVSSDFLLLLNFEYIVQLEPIEPLQKKTPKIHQ